MQTTIKALYTNQVIKAVYNNGNLENEPMFDNTIKVYKNMTNTIGLEIKRIDRKFLLITSDKTYYMNIMNPTTDDFLLRIPAEVIQLEKGRLNIKINPGHLENLTPGYYRYSITYKDENDMESYLYITSDYNATADIEILDRALPPFKESIIIDNFLEVRQDDLIQTINKLSKIINANVFSQTTKDVVHTYVIYTNEYTGKVIVQGSMDEQPNDNSDWYDIREIEFEDSTETLGYNLEGIHTWIRFKLEHSTQMNGKVDKIVYR